MTKNIFSGNSVASLLEQISRFKQNKRGNIAILTALTLFVIMGIAGLAIDTTAASSYKTRLDTAAKAASIAAVNYAQTYIIQNGTSNTTWQTNAQAIGQSTFTSNLSGSGVLSIPTPTISATLANSVVTAQVSYSTQVPTTLGAVLGIRNITVAGSVSSGVSYQPYINFHILLDVSESMNIGASILDQSNMKTMQTVIGHSSGCNFACHGQWFYTTTLLVPNPVITFTFDSNGTKSSSKSTIYTNSNTSAAYGNTFLWAKNAGIKLRIDNAVSALSKMIIQINTYQTNSFCPTNPAICTSSPHYKVAAWTFDNGFSGGGQDGHSPTTGFALTSNLGANSTSDPTSAAYMMANITTPDFTNSTGNSATSSATSEAVPSGITTGSQIPSYMSTNTNQNIIPTGDGGTNIYNALYQLNQQLLTLSPSGGIGTKADPLNVVIFVSDGINDNDSVISSDGLTSSQLRPQYPSYIGVNAFQTSSSGTTLNYVSEIDPTWCTTLKNRNTTIGVLNISYATFQSGSNQNYINNGNSFIASEVNNKNLPNNMQGCASNTSLYQFAVDSSSTTLNNAVNNLINQIFMKMQIISSK